MVSTSNPQEVSEFLDRIARGFVLNPLQYVFFAAILLFLAAGLLIASRVQRGKARRLQARIARERFEQQARRLGLAGEELELLDRMGGGQAGRKLRLLASPAAFDRAAGRLPDRGAHETVLARLRLKLGFQARNPEQVPRASSELPEGLPVLLAWNATGGLRHAGPRRLRLAAEVSAQEAEALVLAPRPGAEPPPPGSPVTVLFQNRAGVFSFHTRVRAGGGGLLRLEQVEELKRTQRRRYYRRRLRLPASVQLRPGEPPLASQLLDLGGAGASLRNPQGKLAVGDLLELRFRLGGESFALEAEVLRLSRGAQVLHVRFPGLRDADRDRLLGVLFRSLGEAAR